MEGRARLCLTMIVKDEAAIIERCLEAAAPWVDAYAVHDTGSSDGTPELVETFFRERGVRGSITHGEFINFEHARNASLDSGRASADVDYLLLCDADMELVVEDPGFARGLDAPAYLVDQVSQADQQVRYSNVRLVRTDVGARYVGATHEYLDVDGHDRAPLAGAWFRDHAEGSSRAVKFERDLRLLQDALDDEPDNARHRFYLAQTLRDSGRIDEAIAAYRHRADLGGWPEEVWYSLHQVAVLAERRGDDPSVVLGAYLEAHEARPTRAETLVELARYLREHDRHALAHVFASRAAELALPDDLLFVEVGHYQWRARDELSISSFWVGRYEESATLARALLADPHLPSEHRARVTTNLQFACSRLP